MKKQRLPRGWSEKQISALAKRHDSLTEDELAAEVKAGLKNEQTTLIPVPIDMVPEVLNLIKKRRKRSA